MPLTRGPASTRWAVVSSATCWANPWSTPTGSFSRSHRDTWVTMGSEGGTGSSSTMTACPLTTDGLPSERVNSGAPPRPSARIPAWRRMAEVTGGSSVWFFGEKASIDGMITSTRSRLRPDHT